MMRFLHSIRASVSLVLLFTLLLGGAYTGAVLGIAQALFHHLANGSLIERGDEVLGSNLIGQKFTGNQYFWGRMSALSEPYDPSNSGGSNLSVNNPKLLEQVNTRIAALQKIDPANKKPIPVSLVTASASGLDPQIPLSAALYQLPRVARVRGLKEADVREVMAHSQQAALVSWLGEDVVNVVTLNLALDEMARGEVKKEKR